MNAPGELRRSAVVCELSAIALRGLGAIAFTPASHVPFTYRGTPTATGPTLVSEGTSLRYAAIAALGLSRTVEAAQREALGGRSAAEFAIECQATAANDPEPGSVALALWAAAEIAGSPDFALLRVLARALDGPVDTVVASWIITAAIAVGTEADELRVRAVARLLAHAGGSGIFPHILPPIRGVRGHVGSFADQVYPAQALARLAVLTGDAEYIALANRTVRRLVDLQGPQGQWWWHYDRRNGAVVEGYPVYSVHQHGMGPMVLQELARAGGEDHGDAVAAGLAWLSTHPECVETLVAADLGVIWRKVGRREPGKAARAAATLATAIRPGLRLPGLDRVFPPGRVDHECRPYELGWLLYAWGEGGGSAS